MVFSSFWNFPASSDPFVFHDHFVHMPTTFIVFSFLAWILLERSFYYEGAAILKTSPLAHLLNIGARLPIFELANYKIIYGVCVSSFCSYIYLLINHIRNIPPDTD